MTVHSFTPHRPRTVGEALELTRRNAPNTAFLAGGTLSVLDFRAGKWSPTHIILLQGVDELVGVSIENEEIVIGAMTTLDDVARHAAFQGALRGMRDAAVVIGGPQIQNIGTVGGNIAAASPASDLLPPLLALDADVTLVSAEGARTVPMASLLLAGGAIDLKPGEIIRNVRLRPPHPGGATVFLKVGRRKAMEVAIASVAARLTIDPETRSCRDVRIVIGAAVDRVCRSATAEEFLEGGKACNLNFEEAGHRAADSANPFSDHRASRQYRRMLLQTLVPRALNLCAERIAEARSS